MDAPDSIYLNELARYKKFGLELTMSEAVQLRRIIEQCRLELRARPKLFYLKIESESRFFMQVFGIDIYSYLHGVEDHDEGEKRMRDLMKFIRTVIRQEIEKI